MLIQPPKGTRDVLPQDSHLWHGMEHTMRLTCARYGFRELRTPVFEHTELFLRGVGDTTDVVQKEMYTFKDKGDRSITLKPEGTAGAVRALLSAQLVAGPLPIKLYYVNSPIFRYENPQSGRLREHHQFGIETFGAPEPSCDAEGIRLALDVIGAMGVTGLSTTINSIGCPECRKRYHEALHAFLADRMDTLCGTCHERSARNPLRILDCKVPSCQQALEGAPSVLDYLCDACRDHFARLQDCLRALDIEFTIDPRIVRGLDYYTRTVFEVIAHLPDGNLTVCGGGRYDGLVKMLGGPECAGFGFGMGMERLLLVQQMCGCAPQPPRGFDAIVCTLSADATVEALKLVRELRAAGFGADMDHVGRSLKAQMKYVDKCGAPLALVLGSDEIASGSVKLRDMRTSQECLVARAELVAAIQRALAQ